MKLYRKEKHWSDYWEIHINFPWMGKRFAPLGGGGEQVFDFSEVEDSLGKRFAPLGVGLEYGFSFPTKCCLYVEDEFYWNFTLRILGFGMTIIRQNGY